MGRSHDYYCPECKCHWSPFDCPVCPGCGHKGIYDLNHDHPEDEGECKQECCYP